MTSQSDLSHSRSPVSLEAADFQRTLDSLRPRIGNYQWMWAILRLAARRKGRFPDSLYVRLRRLGNPRRPFFLGRTFDGIMFLGDYRDYPSAAYMVVPHWNSSIVHFMQAQMDGETGIYLDLGANFGVVAATMARHLAGKCEVVAVEPIPETALRAAATFALNQLTNVRLVQAAIGDQDGEITFFASPGNSAIAGVHQHEFQQLGAWKETRVHCRTLDTLLSDKPGRVGLIKIDVEGNELSAVRGGSLLLARDQPAVLFEFTPLLATRYGYGAADITDRISLAGNYHFSVLGEDGGLSEFPPQEGWQEQVNIFGRSESPGRPAGKPA